MKLKYTFECVEMSDEIIAVPVGDMADQVHGVLKLNKEGHEILETLKIETTEQEIINILAKKYDNNIEQLSGYVHKTIQILKNANLLTD